MSKKSILLKSTEQHLIIFALRADTKQHDQLRTEENPLGYGPRTFDPLNGDQELAVKIFGKIKNNEAKDGHGRAYFKEAEIELGTAEKAFLLDLLKREWIESDAAIYIELKKKLE